MGSLPWREKGTRLGCRRGWWRLAALIMIPVLAGYFALYAWLRATDVIDLVYLGDKSMGLFGERYRARVRDDPANNPRNLPVDPKVKWLMERYSDRLRPRSWTMRAMWPAVKLEVAVDRSGWLPWSSIRKRSVLFLPGTFLYDGPDRLLANPDGATGDVLV